MFRKSNLKMGYILLFMMLVCMMPSILKAQEESLYDRTEEVEVKIPKITSYFFNFGIAPQKKLFFIEHNLLDPEGSGFTNRYFSFNMGRRYWYAGIANDMVNVEWKEALKQTTNKVYRHQRVYLNSAHIGLQTPSPIHVFAQIGVGISTGGSHHHVVIPIHIGLDKTLFQRVGLGISYDNYFWLKPYQGVRNRFVAGGRITIGLIPR